MAYTTMARALAGATLLVLSACGGRGQSAVTLASTPDAGGAASVADASSGPDDAGAWADASSPSDDAGPAACGPGGVRIPSAYGMPSDGLVANGRGFVAQLNSAIAGSPSSILAAFDLPGGTYRTLLKLQGYFAGNTLLLDDSTVFFFDASGAAGPTPGVYSIPFDGGAPALVAAVPTAAYAGGFLSPTEVWIRTYDSTANTSSFYAVPKAGGSIGAPVYTSAAGQVVTSFFLDGTTLYWIEVASPAWPEASRATVYSSPVGATLAPVEYAGFETANAVGIVAVSGTVYFGVAQFIPHPKHTIPPPPPPGPSVAPGLYALVQGGAPVLLDATGRAPLAGGGDVFYLAAPGNVQKVMLLDPTTRAIVAYPVASWDAMALARAPTFLFYDYLSGCVVPVNPPPK